jgi:hypothetical protein
MDGASGRNARDIAEHITNDIKEWLIMLQFQLRSQSIPD